MFKGSPPNRKPVRSFSLPGGQFRFFIGSEVRIDNNGEGGEERRAKIVDYIIDQVHFDYYREVKRDVIVAFNGQRQVWKSVVAGHVIEHDLL